MRSDNIFLVILFYFMIPSLVVPPAPRMNGRGWGLLLGFKNMNLHYILAPAVILQSCFSLVPSPEQLILSQPDLISKTDCDLAVGGGGEEPS